MVVLGDKLKELRLEKHLTQQKVADDLGLNSVTYLHYEKNQREPPLFLLIKFAEYYSVSVDFLLGLKDY